MADINLRSVLGRRLTHAEMDATLSNINGELATKANASEIEPPDTPLNVLNAPVLDPDIIAFNGPAGLYGKANFIRSSLVPLAPVAGVYTINLAAGNYTYVLTPAANFQITLTGIAEDAAAGFVIRPSVAALAWTPVNAAYKFRDRIPVDVYTDIGTLEWGGYIHCDERPTAFFSLWREKPLA